METIKKINFKTSLLSGKKVYQGEEIEPGDLQGGESLSDLEFIQTEFFKGRFEKATFRSVMLRQASFLETIFEEAVFSNFDASRYLFEKCRFTSCQFKDSDFSGGGFDEPDFSGCLFENSDFALCEFRKPVFRNATFRNCNFNGSLFEEALFEGAVFENATFLYVEGLEGNLMAEMRSKGARVSPPIEIALSEFVQNYFRKASPLIKGGLIALLFFFLGSKGPSLYQGVKRMFRLEANPLNGVLTSLSLSESDSFFNSSFPLPNYNFSDGMDHWVPFPKNKEAEELLVVNEDFASFPSSLLSNHYQGDLYYSLASKTTFRGDPLENEKVWLPVGGNILKFKLSFYYKQGHPQISLFGKFREGGLKVLAEIQPKLDISGKWVYYSEGVNLSPEIGWVCLKLSRFPEEAINLDDINLEATF